MKFTFTKIGAFLAAMILLYSVFLEHQSRQQTPATVKIDLIPIFSADTNVLIISTNGWKRQVFGENHPQGLIAQYTDPNRSLVIYYTDAQHWDCQTAVSAHIESLSLSENFLWSTQPTEITDDVGTKIRFCYASTAEEETVNGEAMSQHRKVPVLHVVDTTVLNGAIFRSQSTLSYTAEDPNLKPSDNNLWLQKAIEALEKVRFVPMNTKVIPEEDEFDPLKFIEA